MSGNTWISAVPTLFEETTPYVVAYRGKGKTKFETKFETKWGEGCPTTPYVVAYRVVLMRLPCISSKDHLQYFVKYYTYSVLIPLRRIGAPAATVLALPDKTTVDCESFERFFGAIWPKPTPLSART